MRDRLLALFPFQTRCTLTVTSAVATVHLGNGDTTCWAHRLCLF